MALLPPDVAPVFAGVLIVASFFTSALTAAFGIGGGVSLLAVMAAGLPLTTVIPVHGVVQLGSNAGRAAVQRAHIDWAVTAWFCGGGAVGAAIGGATVVNAPDAPLKLAVAAFILFAVWGPKPRGFGRGRGAAALGGALGGLVTMYVGATGPFTAAVLAAQRLDRLAQVATFSLCMSVQHVLKVIAFGILGFAFGPWVLLVTAMIVSGFAGTLAGGRLLRAMPEAVFRFGFRFLMTGLAMLIGVTGLRGLI